MQGGEIARQCHAHDAHSLLDGDVWTPVGNQPTQRLLPFGGSGTTLIAAEKSGRVARLIELDPKYVDVIVRRWEDFTGKQATREADGAVLDQAASDSSTISQ